MKIEDVPSYFKNEFPDCSELLAPCLLEVQDV